MFEIGEYLIPKDEIEYIKNCKGTEDADYYRIVYIVKFKNGDKLEITGDNYVKVKYKSFLSLSKELKENK